MICNLPFYLIFFRFAVPSLFALFLLLYYHPWYVSLSIIVMIIGIIIMFGAYCITSPQKSLTIDFNGEAANHHGVT